MSPILPDRLVERDLASRYGIVVGMDEVGRGSLAGPVCVGAVAVCEAMPPEPAGLTDSKQLSPSRRVALVDPVRAWSLAHAVGWATAAEVDSDGIIGALRLAGWRAVRTVNQQLREATLPSVGAILLDGKHDWFTPPLAMLWDSPTSEPEAPGTCPPVLTQIKADLQCVAVSAASILAKVERDAYMEQLPDCGYHWSSNKGYASKAHREALARLGPSEYHRRSWNLLGTGRQGMSR